MFSIITITYRLSGYNRKKNTKTSIYTQIYAYISRSKKNDTIKKRMMRQDNIEKKNSMQVADELTSSLR